MGLAVLKLGEQGRDAGDEAWGSQDDGGCGKEKDGEEQQEDGLPDRGVGGRQCERKTTAVDE
jgi:hypothetical protein